MRRSLAFIPKSDRRDDQAFPRRGGTIQGCPRRDGLPHGVLHFPGVCSLQVSRPHLEAEHQLTPHVIAH